MQHQQLPPWSLRGKRCLRSQGPLALGRHSSRMWARAHRTVVERMLAVISPGCKVLGLQDLVILQLRCGIRKPLATFSYWALEIWSNPQSWHDYFKTFESTNAENSFRRASLIWPKGSTSWKWGYINSLFKRALWPGRRWETIHTYTDKYYHKLSYLSYVLLKTHLRFLKKSVFPIELFLPTLSPLLRCVNLRL